MRVVLIENANGRLSCDISERLGAIFFHVKLWKWGAHKYREYQRVFSTLLAALREQGHRAVYATPRETDEAAQRLVRAFGFHEVRRRGGYVLMERVL